MTDAATGGRVIAADRPARANVVAATSSLARHAGEARFEVLVEQREDAIARAWARSGVQAATVFQTENWVRAWYATIGRSAGEPLLIAVIDRRAGGLAAMLPLVRRSVGRLRVIEFADCGVSDSNAPALGPWAPTNAGDAQAMWQAIRRALPGADLVRFTKMPRQIEGRPNPLTLLAAARPSSSNGNVLAVTGSWDGYLATLSGTLRKQLRKNWRVFTQHDGAAFRRIDDPDEAVRVLAELETQQGARLRAHGLPYRLDEPAFSAFYRRIAIDGVADGSVILTALMCGTEVVAALLGLARGNAYVMVRTSVGAQRWGNCSPGRLVMMQTLQLLHSEGYRLFDFSVGDYPYKQRLGARRLPLLDLTVALTPRGLPLLAYDRAKQFMRQHPALHGFARRIVKPGGENVCSAADDDRA